MTLNSCSHRVCSLVFSVHDARLLLQGEATPRVDAAPTPWLDELVPLPGGYKTTRRDVLKLLPLAGGFGSIAVALANLKVCARSCHAACFCPTPGTPPCLCPGITCHTIPALQSLMSPTEQYNAPCIDPVLHMLCTDRRIILRAWG